MQHNAKIPSGVVIALYCNEKGEVLIQEVITPEIIACRVLECAYPPVPLSDYDDDDDDDEDEDRDAKGGGKGHRPKPRVLCVPPCFNCMGPGGVACCCNCPPKP
jgi:stringent starvation protein B